MKKDKEYFKNILKDLTKKGIPYAVLRDEDFFKSNKKEAEFDIIVPRKKLMALKLFFKKIPNVRIFNNNIDLTHPFFVKVVEGDFKVYFDFQVGGIAYCGSPILKEDFLFKNTIIKNKLVYLNTGAEFLMLLIHGFVFKKKLKYFKKYEKKFFKLYEKSNHQKVQDHIKKMFGKKLSKKIEICLKNKDIKSLFSLQKKLRFKHLQKNPLRIFPVIISKAMRFRNYFNVDRFFHFINPFKWAPLIAFVGSDGSGKSTLTKIAKSYLDSFELNNKKVSLGVFSFLKNPFKKKKASDTYSKRILSSSVNANFLELIVRIVMQFPNQLKVLYYRKKGLIVVSDRYPYDIVNFYGAKGFLKFLVRKVFQKPTKCFYVKVSPEKLRKRNNDLSLSATKEVVSRIEKNKEYFSMIELKNENFKESKRNLEKHLSKVIKNV